MKKKRKITESRVWARIEIDRALKLHGYAVDGQAADEMRDLLWSVYMKGLDRGRYFRMRKART